MRKYFEIDKKDNNFGYVSVEGNDSKVTLLVEKIENVWLLNSFIYGRVGNTKYRKHEFNDKLYEKNGRGRESKVAKEIMKELYTIALDEINNL